MIRKNTSELIIDSLVSAGFDIGSQRMEIIYIVDQEVQKNDKAWIEEVINPLINMIEFYARKCGYDNSLFVASSRKMLNELAQYKVKRMETNMHDWENLVEQFHIKFNCPVSYKPTLISEKDRLRRARLIISETAEFVESADKNDMVGMVDALCDILYVTLGTFIELGVDSDSVFREVCRSNLSKCTSKDAGGKVMKGPDYSPPDLEKCLKDQGWKND